MRFCLAAFLTFAVAAQQLPQPFPVTGAETPALIGLEQSIKNFMFKYQIPGGSIAIARNGSLLYARGVGFSDLEARTPVLPSTLFRIASLSKPITAVAVMKLVEQGRLRLEDRAFDIITDLRDKNGTIFDPRMRTITIGQLLNHTSGVADNGDGDPMYSFRKTALLLGIPSPANCSDTIRLYLGIPLFTAPGTRYGYSNFGYCILGRVIERVTRTNYEDHVRQEVLAPMGITSMRVGRTLLADRFPNEATYHMPPGSTLAQSVFGLIPTMVPWPYGGWYHEAKDSGGGWIASAADLARFLSQLDGKRDAPFLSASTFERLFTRPVPPVSQGAREYYGFGWAVEPQLHLSHSGAFAGSITFMKKLANGTAYVALFNLRPVANSDYWSELERLLDYAMQAQVIDVAQKDEFENFLPNLPLSIADRNGVVNGASFGLQFAPGSWVTIRGRNLAASSRTWRNEEIVNGALPSTLDGVRVLIDGKPASIYFISPEQLNVQAPEGTPTGPVKVEVIRDGIGRDVRMGDMRANAPALFSYSAAGLNWAAAIHLDGAVVGTEAVTGTRVLKPGDRALLFGTGFGSATAGRLLSQPVALNQLPTVTLGGQPLFVEFAGYVSSGLVQINVQIPAGFAASGDLPLVVTWGTPALPTQSGLRLPIRAN